MENETELEPKEILETYIEIPLPEEEGKPTRYIRLLFTRPDSNKNTLWVCRATDEFIADALETFNGH